MVLIKDYFGVNNTTYFLINRAVSNKDSRLSNQDMGIY